MANRLPADEEAIVRAKWQRWHQDMQGGPHLPGQCHGCDWTRLWATLDAVRSEVEAYRQEYECRLRPKLTSRPQRGRDSVAFIGAKPLDADEEVMVREKWGSAKAHWEIIADGRPPSVPGICPACDWARAWATLDAVRAELAMGRRARAALVVTAIAVQDALCKERDKLRADLATERAAYNHLGARHAITEQERDAARALLARVVAHWSEDSAAEKWPELLREARALLGKATP